MEFWSQNELRTRQRRTRKLYVTGKQEWGKQEYALIFKLCTSQKPKREPTLMKKGSFFAFVKSKTQ